MEINQAPVNHPSTLHPQHLHLHHQQLLQEAVALAAALLILTTCPVLETRHIAIKQGIHLVIV